MYRQGGGAQQLASLRDWLQFYSSRCSKLQQLDKSTELGLWSNEKSCRGGLWSMLRIMDEGLHILFFMHKKKKRRSKKQR